MLLQKEIVIMILRTAIEKEILPQRITVLRIAIEKETATTILRIATEKEMLLQRIVTERETVHQEIPEMKLVKTEIDKQILYF